MPNTSEPVSVEPTTTDPALSNGAVQPERDVHIGSIINQQQYGGVRFGMMFRSVE